MARLSRAESQAATRERLLAAARHLFKNEGYAAASVEKIADAAGFSKGALYSNFEGKEAIFLAVLEAQGDESLSALAGAIERAPTSDAIVDILVDWANERSASGGWSLTILEHARIVGRGSASLLRQEAIIRRHWQHLGNCLLQRLPGLPGDGETIGALLHEIAYAPAMTFVSRPNAGDLMRLAATELIKGGQHAKAPAN